MTSNIDYNKLFNEEYFSYKDQFDNIQQYFENNSFNLTDKNKRLLFGQLSMGVRCFVAKAELEDCSVQNITETNLIGYVESAVSDVYIDLDKNISVEYAVAPSMIGNVNEGDRIFLFYFEDDNVEGKKIVLGYTDYQN